MTFINNILNYKSLSVVGLEKNTGKTECLNYILLQLKDCKKSVAITSIGIDGETIDQIYQNQKPEITVYEGMTFVTTEKHYRLRKVTSEIIDILNYSSTAMGRLIVAKAINTGKILLSGPPDTCNLKHLIHDLDSKYSSDITIVDGALSRLSLGAPAITDAMILTTGAALSLNIPELVRKTKYVFDLINLPEINDELKNKLEHINNSIWAIDNNNIHDLHIQSVFLLNKSETNIFQFGNTLFIPGAVSDIVIEKLKTQKDVSNTVLIIRDFTRLFVTPDLYYSFIRKGGQIRVIDKPNLIAVTANPLSPSGYMLNSEILRDELNKVLNVPIYDVKKM